MLRNRKKFRDLVETWKNGSDFLIYCDILDWLAVINNKVYKNKIGVSDDFLAECQIAINNLKRCWIVAELSITVKSHNLFEHAVDWMRLHDMTLGPIGAQDGESVHRIYFFLLHFYAKCLSRELPFIRFNSERFTWLPVKATKSRTKSAKEMAHDEDIAELLRVAKAENLAIPNLNESLENVTLTEDSDDDSDECHLGMPITVESDEEDELLTLNFEEV